MPASRIEFSPSREARWRNTSYDDPGHHLGPSFRRGPSSLVHQRDSYNRELHNLRRYLPLYLSLVPYPQDLFHLHLA